MSRGPYRVSTCAADCCGVAHSSSCPDGDIYWKAYESDLRRRYSQYLAEGDDAAMRFFLMELD